MSLRPCKPWCQDIFLQLNKKGRKLAFSRLSASGSDAEADTTSRVANGLETSVSGDMDRMENSFVSATFISSK
jgi:hypothetical protein